MDCSKPGFPVLHHLPEFAQTHVHWVSGWLDSTVHLLHSHPLPFLPSVVSSIRVFSNELAFPIRWPKYWSFSISPSNEFQNWFPLGLSGLISLLSKGHPNVFSGPQFESINCLAINLLYGPTFTSAHDYWKNHSFDYMDLCRQAMSPLFNTLSRFVIAFLPWSKCL